MSGIFRFYLTILFGLIISSISVAFAYSKADSNRPGGESASEISGWLINNAHYEFASDPTQLSAVEFDLNSPARDVRVKLSSTSSTYFSCINTSHYHWHCNASGVVVASIDELRVIATSK